MAETTVHGSDDEDAPRPPGVDVAPEGRDARAIGEQRRDADDRHDRLRPDRRHERQRQQKPGPVAGKPADDRGREGDAGDGDVMPYGNAEQGGFH
ncbi:MAG TPA: hypothetical protein VKB16_10995 [Beijerinckiaceae bacterium]|nr:hypothetical protein [Beijerinckiaceae bacterium]